MIRQAAFYTHGAAGPSGVDAFAWQHLCSSFGMLWLSCVMLWHLFLISLLLMWLILQFLLFCDNVLVVATHGALKEVSN